MTSSAKTNGWLFRLSTMLLAIWDGLTTAPKTATPTFARRSRLTHRHMPSIDIVHLLDMVVVNVLACNTDAHAKNYAIIIRGNGASIAPMYDLMCGEVWENVTKNLAQKIAGKSRGDHLNGRDWQQFARDIQSGKVKVTVVSEQGKEAVVGMLETAQFFGEGCLNGQAVRVGTARAMEECVITSITRKAMLAALRKDQSFQNFS